MINLSVYPDVQNGVRECFSRFKTEIGEEEWRVFVGRPDGHERKFHNTLE